MSPSRARYRYWGRVPAAASSSSSQCCVSRGSAIADRRTWIHFAGRGNRMPSISRTHPTSDCGHIVFITVIESKTRYNDQKYGRICIGADHKVPMAITITVCSCPKSTCSTSCSHSTLEYDRRRIDLPRNELRYLRPKPQLVWSSEGIFM